MSVFVPGRDSGELSRAGAWRADCSCPDWMKPELEKIHVIFLTEAEEQLASLEQDLLSLEASPGRRACEPSSARCTR